MKNYKVDQIKSLIKDAKTALIVVPQLSVDGIGSALALALSLKKSGINPKVYCPQKTDNNYSRLNGLELISDTYNQNDLIVSLDYPLDQIENVSYNNDGDRLNLVVKTKTDSQPIKNEQIIVQSQAGIADVNFILGDETALGPNANIVNRGNWILVTPTNNASKPWAKATLVDPEAPYSEIFTFLIPMLDLQLDPDSAKDLLIALRVATQSFSVNVSPETFEAGAVCLRATQPAGNGNTNSNEPSPIESIESKPNSGSQPNQASSLPTA